MAPSQTSANVRWVGINQVARIGIQFISVLVLTRLLPPSDYGVMALAAIVTNFALLFRDMGTAAAIVQRKEISPDLLDAIFWFNLTFGVLIGVGTALASPLAAQFFSTPTLTWVLLSLAAVFPLTSSGAPLLAMMERNNQFRKIAIIEVSSNALGLISATIAALLGAGVYSLVLQALVIAGVSVIQLWIGSGWHPRLHWKISELRAIWGFSSNLFFFNCINYFARNSDAILIGRFLGEVSIGYYSIAYRILLFPLQNMTFVISRALLPVYSRQQGNLESIGKLYIRTLSLISLVSAPLMFGIWALRVPFVATMFGSKWASVAGILTWIAPMGFFQSLNSTTGTILSAIGRTDLLRTVGAGSTVLLLISFVAGLPFGLLGITEAYFWATVLITIVTLYITLHHVAATLSGLIQVIWKPLLCAVVMAAVVTIAVSLTNPYWAKLWQLIIFVPVGVAIYLGLLIIFAPSTLVEFLKALGLRWKDSTQ